MSGSLHSFDSSRSSILIWALGVASGWFSSWASSRLWLKGVIRCLFKQGTALAPKEGCLWVFKVSVIHFVLRRLVIGPPPNPQPGGPGAFLFSGLYPLTNPTWSDLPGTRVPGRHSSQGHWDTQPSPPLQGDNPRVRYRHAVTQIKW